MPTIKELLDYIEWELTLPYKKERIEKEQKFQEIIKILERWLENEQK